MWRVAKKSKAFIFRYVGVSFRIVLILLSFDKFLAEESRTVLDSAHIYIL